MRRAGCLGLICSLLIALHGCTFDQGGFDYNDAGSESDPDAAAACQSNAECSALDGACTVGQCSPSGECVAAPAHEGDTCDEPSVGEWSDCEFGAACGLTGDRVRLRADWTCQAGTCEADTTEEHDACQRDPEEVVGEPCGDVQCESGECHPSSMDECPTEGKRTVTCFAPVCGWQGSCRPDSWTSEESCVIDSNGEQCWSCGDGWDPSPNCVCDEGSCVGSDDNGGGGGDGPPGPPGGP